ncbi:uncharacterized protein [Palaemon carinicauda]|uniref:uncharacterized protein n=1 Tax=Palaemon carinicauda TaxID=392227 RepID=UPI0035B61DF9
MANCSVELGSLATGSLRTVHSNKMVLLTAALLLCGTLSAAEPGTPVVATMEQGIEEISSTLQAHESRCSYPTLDAYHQQRLEWLERFVEGRMTDIKSIQNYSEIMQSQIKETLDRYRRTVPTESPDACAAPFQRAAGGCFWAHKGPPLSWRDARDFCQQEGGDLATPQNIPGVVEFLKEELGSGLWYVWLGGKQDAHGNWKWLESDASMDSSDALWDEPEVYPEHVSCAAFRSEAAFKIAVQDCENNNWFLCEKKIRA